MKDKSDIYRLLKKLNGKCYIDSSVNLSTGFSHYLSINYLDKRVTILNSNIYNALLTYGHNNFRLEVFVVNYILLLESNTILIGLNLTITY